MKTNKKPQQIQGINQSFSELRRISLALVSAIVMTFLALSGQAANILNNPGFETAPLFGTGSWTRNSTQTWSQDRASSADGTSIKLRRSGADALWMQGVYGGGAQDQRAQQRFACTPGNTYTADAWYSTYTYQATNRLGGATLTVNSDGINTYCGLFTGTGASVQEDGWVEVRFFDSGNNVIADYKSMIIDPAFLGTASTTTLPTVTNSLGNIYLAWMDFPVTNQYDPTLIPANSDPDTQILNGAITNTLGSGQYITAPPGAVMVEFGIHLYQTGTQDGAPFWDDCTLNLVSGVNPSIIGNLSPDGTSLLNGAKTNFTFSVISSSAGGAPLATNSTSSIGVVVNGQDKLGSLQFSGTSTNWNVTLPGLTTNTVYTINISVTNSVGLVSSGGVTFDTFSSNYFIVSSEDYDYTNGLFIQNPIHTSSANPNSYFGLAGTLGVDISTYGGTGVLPGGSSELVRSDNNVAFQRASDAQLPEYLAENDPGVYNVQIAYNNGGNWENYTRVYPTGNYIIYARINSGNGGVEYLNLLTSGYGTTTQTTNNLGAFLTPNGTASGYMWIPLTDIYGTAISVSLPAGQQTLQLLSGGGDNFVSFMFVPTGTSGFAPLINNLIPNNVNPPVNGNVFMQGVFTNITFSVSSTFSTVATSNIHILVNGVDISPLATFSGNNTNWSVSVPAPQNQLLTLVINAMDAAGISNSVTETFDTFSQNNLMIEAEDFDFNHGQFIDNPVPTGNFYTATNSYYSGGIDGTNASAFNVDFNSTYDGGEPHGYRADNIGTEITTDFLRAKFIATGAHDYDIGYWNGGQWLDYTRTFPADNYNVYGRLAGGNGPLSNTTLKLVTAGAGTTNQTTQLLGSFADPKAAGWQVWHWVPMMGTNGQLAIVSLGGVETVRATSGNNVNANYFMFVPAVSHSVMTASISGSSILLKFPTQIGHSYTVLYRNSLTEGSWLPLSNIPVNGDGTVQTVTDTLGGSQRFYKLLIE